MHPSDVLRALLRLYWLGQTLPLPLFPGTSRLYADAVQARASLPTRRSTRPARNSIAGRERGQPGGESDDVHVRQVYGDAARSIRTFRPVEPEGAADFGAVAVAVFGPLLAHLEDGRMSAPKALDTLAVPLRART